MPDPTPPRAAGHRWSRWWTGRSNTARIELFNLGGFLLYALALSLAGAATVAQEYTSRWAQLGTLALFLGYALLTGYAGAQALHWTVGRRGRPTVPMAAATVAAVLVLPLVLNAHSPADTTGGGTAYTFAVGCTTLPLAIMTIRALPFSRICAMVAAAVAVVAATGALCGLPGGAVGVNAWLALWLSTGSILFSRSCGWVTQITWELLDARDTRARLAVAEERLRFARDLHDVMGSNLSVLALKSELAARLARRGATDAAAEQMDEVQRTAREAQAEIRAVVRGYREADLATELSGARGVLESAGIDCAIDTPGRDGTVPLAPRTQAALGWVVREATTNVLRHADAASCEIRLRVRADQAVLTVANNGAHRPAQPGGTGLAGLRERLAALGGTLTTRAQDGTFVLTASVPRQEER